MKIFRGVAGAVAVGSVLALAGCGEGGAEVAEKTKSVVGGTMDRAGEAIETGGTAVRDAADNVGVGAAKATEAVGKGLDAVGLDKAGEAVKGAADTVGAGAEKATDSAGKAAEGAGQAIEGAGEQLKR